MCTLTWDAVGGDEWHPNEWVGLQLAQVHVDCSQHQRHKHQDERHGGERLHAPVRIYNKTTSDKALAYGRFILEVFITDIDILIALK